MRGSNPNKTAILCQFHKEKTPSLILDHAEKTFHCIGCGAEGTFTEGEDKLFLLCRLNTIKHS